MQKTEITLNLCIDVSWHDENLSRPWIKTFSTPAHKFGSPQDHFADISLKNNDGGAVSRDEPQSQQFIQQKVVSKRTKIESWIFTPKDRFSTEFKQEDFSLPIFVLLNQPQFTINTGITFENTAEKRKKVKWFECWMRNKSPKVANQARFESEWISFCK